MTEQTPADAVIEALGHRMCWRYKHSTDEHHSSTYTFNRATLLDFARAVLDKFGNQPAGAGGPVTPDFFTACAWYEGCGEGGWIALPGYSNETEHGVKHLVLEAARKEGYKGTATGRLMELGWEIRPVYLAPQPTQAQAGAVPLTCEWTHNDDDGFWETACGEAWRFDDGGPAENSMHFCHSCGKSLCIKGGQHGAT